MPSVDETIGKFSRKVLPQINRLLDRRLIFKGQLSRIQQGGEDLNYFRLGELVTAAQHPLSFQQHEKADQYQLSRVHLPPYQPSCPGKLFRIVPHQVTDHDIGVDAEH